MIRRPPRSTLFPSPPLSRSQECKCVVPRLYAYVREHGLIVHAWSSTEDASTSSPAATAARIATRSWRASTCTGCGRDLDRKSTRLNSTHRQIPYALLCLTEK